MYGHAFGMFSFLLILTSRRDVRTLVPGMLRGFSDKRIKGLFYLDIRTKDHKKKGGYFRLYFKILRSHLCTYVLLSKKIFFCLRIWSSVKKNKRGIGRAHFTMSIRPVAGVGYLRDSRLRTYSQAASNHAPVPKFDVLFTSTTWPGIAFSPMGCT